MAEVLLVNPRRRKRRAKSRRRRAHRAVRRRRSYSAAPRRRRRRSRAVVSFRRRRSNPSLRLGSIPGQVVPTLTDGAIGAAGGLANDALYGFLKPRLPEALQSGLGRSATKIFSAILVGIAANMVMRGKGKAFATGAATVVLHEAIKAQLVERFPQLPLGEYDGDMGFYDPATPVAGYLTEQAPDSVGAYVGVGAYETEEQVSDLDF